MPITITLLEPRIILQQWTGIVTMDDVFTSSNAVRVLADEQRCAEYASILDGTGLEQFQFDLRGMLRAIEMDNRDVGIYIVHGPSMAQIAARVMDKLVKKDIKVCRDLAHAQALARACLEAYPVKPQA
ncbi:MAG: hypothetical protein SF162_14000 [bacterium]|nr:hypothetical protein [bacterium]